MTPEPMHRINKSSGRAGNSVYVVHRFWSLAAAISLLLVPLLPIKAMAQTITQGYDADTTLQRGMIVALKKDDFNKVEAINNSRINDIHGVVVTGNDAAIAISGDNQKVYVASGGKFEVLVSDLNGAISTGDYITLSSVNGVGMKSDDIQPIVIGKALQGFSGANDPQFVSKATVKDTAGKEKQIDLGRITVDIIIGKNPLVRDTDAPLVLQRIGEAIAGHPVSGPRIYLALGVLILAVGVSGSVIYSAVHSGLISIGRNPLSKKLISRSMLQMVMVGFIIFFITLFGVYLILRL